MSNLARIENQNIAVANQFGGSAVEKRIAMLSIPEVQDSLSQVEKSLFLASTKKPISSIDKEKLFSDVKKMLGFLKKDLGIKAELDSYDYARFFDIVSRYFSELSFMELKIAFEMAMIGELDNFLPKNGNGEPDKGHYQSLSFEYISKILTAYRKKRNSLLNRAYSSIPIAEKKISKEEIDRVKHLGLMDLRKKALKYKYSGVLDLGVLDEKLMHDRLVESGYADEIYIANEDKQRAMFQLINSAMINSMQKHSINKTGTKHEDVKWRGYVIARRKELVRALDLCNKLEIQINQYLK